MADQIYKVQDPQGNIRQISGPAGASEAEIIEQAQKLFTPAPATPAPPPVAAPKSKYVNLMSMLPPKEESPLPGLYMGATDPFYAGGRLAMETGIGDKQAMDKAIAEREAKYQAGRQNKGFDTSIIERNENV